MGRAIEAARLKEATSDAMIHFFNEFERVVTEYGIDLENIYNFDESGFAQGMTETNNVIINVNARILFQAQQGRQEWTIVVECICTDGSSVPPLVIFKDENMLYQWLPTVPPTGWAFCANSKGQTSNYHQLRWLTKCFDTATRDKANGKWRLLICDGHESHVSADFVAFCIDNRIHLFGLPPHTSHLVQPLDVASISFLDWPI
jgi:DDE superfamily endonuclease